VEGGKAYQLIVEQGGVFTGPQGVADDGIFSDLDETAGRAYAAAFAEVFQDAEYFVVRQAGIKERGAFAFGEAVLAGAADEQTSLFLGAVAEADAEVVEAALAIVGAVGVLAAEAAEVVHRKAAVKVFRDT
jgi:hypothetical protein